MKILEVSSAKNQTAQLWAESLAKPTSIMMDLCQSRIGSGEASADLEVTEMVPCLFAAGHCGLHYAPKICRKAS